MSRLLLGDESGFSMSSFLCLSLKKELSIDSSNNMLHFCSILQGYWGSLIYSILNEMSSQRML